MEAEDLTGQPLKKRALVVKKKKSLTGDKNSVIITPQATPCTTPQHTRTSSFMDSDEELNSGMSTEEEFMEDEDSELSSGDGKYGLFFTSLYVNSGGGGVAAVCHAVRDWSC